MKKSKKSSEPTIVISRVQWNILRHKQPDIYSIAKINVVGSRSNLRAFLWPIEGNSDQLNSILSDLFPTMKIPITS